jgi:hypothetical protein
MTLNYAGLCLIHLAERENCRADSDMTNRDAKAGPRTRLYLEHLELITAEDRTTDIVEAILDSGEICYLVEIMVRLEF